MAERVFLDWNAGAPLHPEARAALIAALEVVGNPSSVHAEGRAARNLVETAREEVAALVGAEPRNVTFTSGGSEANTLALTPHWQMGRETRPLGCLLVSAIEHPSVLAGGRFPTNAVAFLPVTPHGVVELAALDDRLSVLRADSGDTRPLVSIMHVNNETGVVQPIAAAAERVHAAGGLLHVDAVQSAGRIACEIDALGADLMTLSGHKIGAPKGVGALVRRDAGLHLADPLVKGGGQERGFRAGTEAVALISAFGAAARAARRDRERNAAAMVVLRDRLEGALKAGSPALVVIGAEAARAPGTSLVALPGLKAETAVIALDLAGFAVSSGSACSSGKVGASHVLAAMGTPAALAASAVRVGLGPTTTEHHIDAFTTAWNTLTRGLSREGRGIAA